MNDQEKQALASRLAGMSDVLDFSTALQLVNANPTKAVELLRARERSREEQAELARTSQRLQAAVLR